MAELTLESSNSNLLCLICPKSAKNRKWIFSCIDFEVPWHAMGSIRSLFDRAHASVRPIKFLDRLDIRTWPIQHVSQRKIQFCLQPQFPSLKQKKKKKQNLLGKKCRCENPVRVDQAAAEQAHLVLDGHMPAPVRLLSALLAAHQALRHCALVTTLLREEAATLVRVYAWRVARPLRRAHRHCDQKQEQAQR